MIKVTRLGGAPPEIAKLAKNEEARNSTKPKDQKTFKVYSDRRIKDCLHQTFHGKCAYCESKYQATQPMDVEHWRPKSVYWFLAAEWDNLFPSCIDCNRQREHTVPLPDGSEAKIVLGKMDQFPLESGAPAANRAALAGEKPLLLDPCTDNPEDFFEYTKQGVIRPKSAHPRSVTSITVYALNRMGLVHGRYERQLLAGKHIHRISQLARAMQSIDSRPVAHPSDPELRAMIEDLIRYEMNALRGMCDASEPYAAQSRQLVKEFFDSPNGSPAWLLTR